jgi:hypothetical protein
VSPATADDARAYSIWTALEREFALGEGRAAQGLLLPRHSKARFEEFLFWVAADTERARHLETVSRAAGVFLPETRLTNWAADDGVAAMLQRLIEERELVAVEK